MSRLFTFFRNSYTGFGIFYPRRYLLAVFPNLVNAGRAKPELNQAGRVDDDVVSAPVSASRRPQACISVLQAGVDDGDPRAEEFAGYRS